MRRHARILLAVLAATVALWVPRSAVHAGVLPCSGYGGQGAGGYVSSLVENCLNTVGH
jgi:hypothetical protein